MLAKASQCFLSNIKDYGSDGPWRWRHQESISGMERRAQFTPSPGSFRFEFRLSRFARSAGLELFREASSSKARSLRDLADTFAGEGERLAHFLERVLAAVLHPEAHLDDLFLAWGEGLQY